MRRRTFDQNPFVPSPLKSQMGVTLILLALLGMVFLKGFREAIGIATILVGLYLGLNLIVTCVALWEVLAHPHLIPAWRSALLAQHGDSALAMVGLSLVLFPKLALGCPGLNTRGRDAFD